MNRTKFDEINRDLEEPTNVKLDIDEPIVVRVDGKNFHSYIKNFGQHFSIEMQNAMNAALSTIMNGIVDFDFGYTNSDEITLVMLPKRSNHIRVEKIVSWSASYATAGFNKCVKFEKPAIFDARVFNCHDYNTVKDNLIWRQQSGMRNSVNTYGREFLKKSEMKYKGINEIEDLLKKKNIPLMQHSGFYYGYYMPRRTMTLNVARGDIGEILDVYLDN